jgi:segregation and condensation protein B
MPMTAEEIRGAVQAILFVAGEPVSIEQLSDALGGEPPEAIAAEVELLRAAFDQEGSGIVLEQTGGGFRFASRPAFDPYLRKFFHRQSEARLSMAGLETLAIVAYRQPITAPEINEIRGVNSAGVLRTLLDRRMVRVAGRKPVVGSPFLYRTTKEFLVHFGLNNIQDLPRLEEFSEMLGVNLPEDLVLPDEIVLEAESAGGEEASFPDTFVEDQPDSGESDERSLTSDGSSAFPLADDEAHDGGAGAPVLQNGAQPADDIEQGSAEPMDRFSESSGAGDEALAGQPEGEEQARSEDRGVVQDDVEADQNVREEEGKPVESSANDQD